MYMRGFIVFLFFACMIGGGLIVIKTLDDIVDELETVESAGASNIGNSIVLKNDTLMIIDYSFINSNYTLDDGRTISVELVDKLLLDERY